METLQTKNRPYKDSLIDTANQGVQFQPRNPNQIKYLRSKVGDAKKLGPDELVTLHELAYMLPDFIWSVSSVPNLAVTFGIQKVCL